MFALLSRTRQTTTENFVAKRLSGQVGICADLSIFIKKMLEKPCMNLVICLHLRVLMVSRLTVAAIRMTILESNEEIDVIVNKVVAKLVILLRLHCTERRLFSWFSSAVN